MDEKPKINKSENADNSGFSLSKSIAIDFSRHANDSRLTWVTVGKALSKQEILDHSPNVRSTAGCYYVCFKPQSKLRDGNGTRKWWEKFIIKCDFAFPDMLYYRFQSYSAVKRMGKQDPWVKFMVDYTTLSRDMFDMAACNIDMKVYFCIDWKKYMLDKGMCMTEQALWCSIYKPELHIGNYRETEKAKARINSSKWYEKKRKQENAEHMKKKCIKAVKRIDKITEKMLKAGKETEVKAGNGNGKS